MSEPLSHLASVQVCHEGMKTQFLNKKFETNSVSGTSNAYTNEGIIKQTAFLPQQNTQYCSP